MTKTDKDWWQVFRENLTNTIQDTEYRKVCELHAYYFNHKINYPCKCSPAVIQTYIDDLNKLYLND